MTSSLALPCASSRLAMTFRMTARPFSFGSRSPFQFSPVSGRRCTIGFGSMWCSSKRFRIRQYVVFVEKVLGHTSNQTMVEFDGSRVHQSTSRFGEQGAIGKKLPRAAGRDFVEAVRDDEHGPFCFPSYPVDDLVQRSNDCSAIGRQFEGSDEIVTDLEFQAGNPQKSVCDGWQHTKSAQRHGHHLFKVGGAHSTISSPAGSRPGR